MDYFDIKEKYGKSLNKKLKGTSASFCIISFSSDWLFPTREAKHIVNILNSAGTSNVTFTEIKTTKGHDAFLLDEPDFHKVISGFLK